jgi:hypothetical protein
MASLGRDRAETGKVRLRRNPEQSFCYYNTHLLQYVTNASQSEKYRHSSVTRSMLWILFKPPAYGRSLYEDMWVNSLETLIVYLSQFPSGYHMSLEKAILLHQVQCFYSNSDFHKLAKN